MLRNFKIKPDLGATHCNGNEKKGQKKATKQARKQLKKKKIKQKRKKETSSVRHTRAIQRDRSSKRQVAPPPDEKIKACLTKFLKPSEAEEQGWFDHFNLRMRKLTLTPCFCAK